MTRKTRLETLDRTPLARLSEGTMHGIVGYQLAQATIVTDQVFDDRMGPAELRQLALTVLALVQANPDVTARQLARALAVTPPNIAVGLDRLELRGLLLRTRSLRDARVQHIRLTAAGETLVQQSLDQLLEGESLALDMLSAAERAMLIELLHKVALARRRGDGPG